MNKSERAIAIKKILDKTYPETPIPLHHKDNFSLLVAVLLSAQCTDERVNEITPKLFSVASDPVSMSKVSINKIYKIIKYDLKYLYQFVTFLNKINTIIFITTSNRAPCNTVQTRES